MVDKCAICGAKIESHYLNKRLGTFVKVGGKGFWICSSCQSSLGESEIKKRLSK